VLLGEVVQFPIDDEKARDPMSGRALAKVQNL